jgi:hypothetical protein
MPKVQGENIFFQGNLCYYTVDVMIPLQEQKLWGILTEAKRSLKPFFDCGAKAAA